MIAAGACVNDDCPSDSHFVYLVEHDSKIIVTVFVCYVCGHVDANEVQQVYP
jgi:hypothetical protein